VNSKGLPHAIGHHHHNGRVAGQLPVTKVAQIRWSSRAMVHRTNSGPDTQPNAAACALAARAFASGPFSLVPLGAASGDVIIN